MTSERDARSDTERIARAFTSYVDDYRADARRFGVGVDEDDESFDVRALTALLEGDDEGGLAGLRALIAEMVRALTTGRRRRRRGRAARDGELVAPGSRWETERVSRRDDRRSDDREKHYRAHAGIRGEDEGCEWDEGVRQRVREPRRRGARRGQRRVASGANA